MGKFSHLADASNYNTLMVKYVKLIYYFSTKWVYVENCG